MYPCVPIDWLTRALALAGALVVATSAACDLSETTIDERAVERVIIIDQQGKHWDVTQAVVRYGFDPEAFRFGIGMFALTPHVLPPFLGPGDPGYPAPGESFDVIGLAAGGDARAYRTGDLLFHEVVDDIVDGVPVLVVHRPLLGSSAAYARVLDADTLTMAASGWVYDDQSVLVDYQTESLWYRLGADDHLTCVSGVHFQRTLAGRGTVAQPWNQWVARESASLLMFIEPPTSERSSTRGGTTTPRNTGSPAPAR